MERYKVTLTGGPTSMLMHADDVLKNDQLQAYRGAAKAKGKGAKSVAGDDRTPPWSYWTYLYHDEKSICLTDLQISACLMKGATEFKMSGKKGKTLKSASQTLLQSMDPMWPIMVERAGKKGMHAISVKELFALGDEAPFEDHVAKCADLGFLLDVRRAAVGQSKHVRVRPRFPAGWQVQGEIRVIDETLISGETLQAILEYCGDFVGLGDWRPSSPKKPGPHGRFTAKLQKIG